MKEDAVRRILVDARTPVHYTMFAPVHRVMRDDPRVRFSFISSDDPARGRKVFRDAGSGVEVIGRARAVWTKFDAYVTADFTWTPLPRGTCRIQMFHGVGGKYGFDAPTESLNVWDRLFFVNRRRLLNCVAAGALASDSPAIRLVGMPKVDRLVDGTFARDKELLALGLAPDLPSVLYAPTWSPASSLNLLGLDLIKRLSALPINLIVKLHDRSRDPEVRYSGGHDWPAAIRPLLKPGRGLLAPAADICPYLMAADVMVTDHSSAAFEYLLLDKPIVRIHVPELLALANVHPDYVSLLSDVSESVVNAMDVVAAVEMSLSDPGRRSECRRLVAADLFHEPGGATARCAAALYEAVSLPLPEVPPKAPPFHPGPMAQTSKSDTRAREGVECRP